MERPITHPAHRPRTQRAEQKESRKPDFRNLISQVAVERQEVLSWPPVRARISLSPVCPHPKRLNKGSRNWSVCRNSPPGSLPPLTYKNSFRGLPTRLGLRSG